MTKTYYYNPPRLRTTLAITAGIGLLAIGMLVVGFCEYHHSHCKQHTPVSLEAQADKWVQSSESRVNVSDMARHSSIATMYEVRLLRQEVQTLNSNITYLIDHLPERDR